LNASRTIAFVLLATLLGAASAGARGFGPGQGEFSGPRPAQGPNRQGAPAGERRYRSGEGVRAGDWLRQHKDLSPAEQQRALESDPAFRGLPADRQERLRERLQKFNSLPPQQRDVIIQRMQAWNRLDPDQRNRARDLFSQFRNLPEDRRSRLTGAFRSLREMNPQERQRVFTSPGFLTGFTNQEREILRGMTELNIGPAQR